MPLQALLCIKVAEVSLSSEDVREASGNPVVSEEWSDWPVVPLSH